MNKKTRTMIISIISNISNYIEKITYILVEITLVLMLLVGIAHVFWRYALNNSLSWTEEVLSYGLAYFSLLGASVVLKRKGHIGVVFIRDKMPNKMKEYFLKLSSIIELFVSLTVSITGIILMFQVKNQVTPALYMSMAIPLFSVALSFIFMFIYALEHVINDFCK